MPTTNSATIYHLIIGPRIYLVPNFIGKAYKFFLRSDHMIEILNDLICHSIIGYNILSQKISVGLLPWDCGKLIFSSYKVLAQIFRTEYET